MQYHFFLLLNLRDNTTPEAMTDLCFSNTFTVVSLASELTKLTISINTEGSRKCDAISAVHCWTDVQPVQQR